MMTHDDAVTAALTALGNVLTQDHPDTDQTAAARFVLQQLRNGQSETLSQDAAVSIPSSVLIQLLTDALKVPALVAAKANAEERADGLWGIWRKARAIMKKRGKHDDKVRDAMFQMGLVGEVAGKGGNRVDHRGMASHYHLLRTGGHHFENGELIAVQPHSFNDAVVAIEARYGIDWESLKRESRRQKFTLMKKAEVYPVD
jgi:hypothetical protein